MLGPDAQPCPCQVLHRPAPLSPAEANLLLGAHRPRLWHRSSLAGMQLNSWLRRGITLLDRTNSAGVRDCLLVGPFLPCVPACEDTHDAQIRQTASLGEASPAGPVLAAQRTARSGSTL